MDFLPPGQWYLYALGDVDDFWDSLYNSRHILKPFFNCAVIVPYILGGSDKSGRGCFMKSLRYESFVGGMKIVPSLNAFAYYDYVFSPNISVYGAFGNEVSWAWKNCCL